MSDICTRCGNQIPDREWREQQDHISCTERDLLDIALPDPVPADDITESIMAATEILETLQELREEDSDNMYDRLSETYDVTERIRRTRDRSKIRRMILQTDTIHIEIIQNHRVNAYVKYPYDCPTKGRNAWKICSETIANWSRSDMMRDLSRKGFGVDADDADVEETDSDEELDSNENSKSEQQSLTAF